MTYLKDYINCSRISIAEIVKEKDKQQTFLDTEGRVCNKGNHSITNAYIQLNESVSAICTNFARSRCLRNGKWCDVIERQNDNEETHYRAMITIETLKLVTFDKQKYDNETFMKQLFQFSRNPYQAKIEIAPNVSIVTNPIRIDLVTSDRASKMGLIDYSTNVENRKDIRLSNLKGNPTSKIVLVILEFYKPFYKDLLTENSKGSIGSKYIRYTSGLQNKIKNAANDMFSDINCDKSTTHFNKNRKFCSVTHRVFDLLALHDNGDGEYVRFDVAKCALLCFSSLVKKKGNNNEYISKKNKIEIRSRIKMILFLFKEMGKKNDMNGMRFIPVELLDKELVDSRERLQYFIRVVRPRVKGANIYSAEDMK